MSTDHTDHVHRLIRSMTRQEKRYFKLYAGRHLVGGKSTCLSLFDVIADMESYSEDRVREHFAGATFLRRFTVTKHRLYDTILASLEAFHAESSVEARLNRQMHRVEILYQRGLYTDAERMLRGVRAMGEQHGKAHILVQAMEWDRRLMERTNYEGVQGTDLGILAARGGGLLTELELLEQLWQLKSRSFILLYRQGKARSEEGEAECRALLTHPLLQEGPVPASPKVRFQRHHILSVVAFALNDMPLCEQQLTSNEQLLQEEAAHFQDEPHLALSVLSNLAFVRLRLCRYAEALEGLKRFKRIPAMMPTAPSPDLEMKVFAMGTSLELALLCRTGDFERAVEKLKDVKSGIERFDDRLSVIRKSGIRFQAAWACFGAGRLEEASQWCRALLNERGIEPLEEIHAMGRLLDLLILMESGKVDLLVYAVRNVERFLRHHHRHHRFERALLTYVRSHLRAGSPSDRQSINAALVHELSALEGDTREQAVFDHFDPLCFALAKLKGCSMGEAARERASAGRTTPKPNGQDKKAA